jgi:hypothetical protein
VFIIEDKGWCLNISAAPRKNRASVKMIMINCTEGNRNKSSTGNIRKVRFKILNKEYSVKNNF